MKFFILGDSWGVGEYTRSTPGNLESVPDTGLDYYLRKMGHTVKNISAGSAGNFGQLRHAYWTLKEHSDYDYIIWFHTESMRDIQEILIDDPHEGQRYFPDFDIDHWESALDYLDTENYRYAQMIYDEFAIPFIVIGGQCPVNQSICQFSFAKVVVTSWLQQLLKLESLPPKNTFFSWEKIQKILLHYNYDEKKFIVQNFESLERSQEIIELARISQEFPDGCHPSRQCFAGLADQILSLIIQP